MGDSSPAGLATWGRQADALGFVADSMDKCSGLGRRWHRAIVRRARWQLSTEFWAKA